MHRTSKRTVILVSNLLLWLLAGEASPQGRYNFCANTNGKNFGGTVQYDATSGGQTIVAGTYNNLTLRNTSGSETASGALTVDGTQRYGVQ
jgi:hypothetical protein